MAIPGFKLSRFFNRFKPVYVLGTTYTVSFAFFESVVFPCIDQSRLKRCLVLCDKKGFRRATSEAFALRSATREYLAAPAPCAGSFHPKVWVMTNQDKLALLVGSGNLTQSGFIENFELFEIIEIEKGDAKLELAEDVLKFVNGLTNLWPPESKLLAVDSLQQISNHIKQFSESLTTGDGKTRLLSSFEADFPTQLASHAEAPDSIYVASPFFGGSTKGLISLIDKVKPNHLHLFPAIHNSDCIDVPVNRVAELDNVSIGHNKFLTKRNRFSHLKLYGIQRETDFWLFNSSVNCTHAALNGPNVESGLIRPVSEDVFREHFPEEYDTKLRTDKQLEVDYCESNWITLWATDLGRRVVLETGTSPKLPLSDVTIEFRSGGLRSEFQAGDIFKDSNTFNFDWDRFKTQHNATHAARILMIRGTDATGNKIEGTAFVDDLAAVQSEPRHRNAWRAAVNLLSMEGVPQYSDIASLFSLIEDIAFDELDEENVRTNSVPAGSIPEISKDKAAVWPPVPMDGQFDLTPIDGFRSGDLHWFDKILASLVRRSKSQNEPEATSVSNPDDENEIVEVDPRIVKDCNKVWSHVSSEFERYCLILNRLEIEDGQTVHANCVWGPAAFLLLAILAVRKAAAKGSGNQLDIPRSTNITDEFLALLFATRIQHDDYNPSARHVYADNGFPPIADDLADRFGLYPHYEIVAIILVAFSHLHAAGKNLQGGFVTLQWRLFCDVAGDQLEMSLQDSDHLKNLWQSYFQDESEAVEWADVQNSIDEITMLTWEDFEGFQLLRDKRRFIRTGEYQVSEGSSGVCQKLRCALMGRINPNAEREFRKLHPVQCRSCHQWIIPQRLFRAYENYGGVKHG